MTAAVEVLKNSPRIAKLIEEGHTKDILEEIENSVGLYRMQSMNQSLIALLVHQKITYQDGAHRGADPRPVGRPRGRVRPVPRPAPRPDPADGRRDPRSAEAGSAAIAIPNEIVLIALGLLRPSSSAGSCTRGP